jgi:hypothetical protein
MNNVFYTSACRSFATTLCILPVLCVVSDTQHIALYSLDGRSGTFTMLDCCEWGLHKWTVVGGWEEGMKCWLHKQTQLANFGNF